MTFPQRYKLFIFFLLLLPSVITKCFKTFCMKTLNTNLSKLLKNIKYRFTCKSKLPGSLEDGDDLATQQSRGTVMD